MNNIFIISLVTRSSERSCANHSASLLALFNLFVLRRSDQLQNFSAPRPPPTASPLPLLSASRAGAGRQPVPVLGHGPARHGPVRDVTSRVTVSRWPRRGNVTRDRDHRPPALPPGPLPNRCPLFGVRRCARAPTGVCQGLRVLTQRSPRSGRFTAIGFEPARRIGGEGLFSRLSWIAPKCGGAARSSRDI